MAIIRWTPAPTPLRDLVTVQEEMNRLFDGVFGRPLARAAFDFSPVVDIEENAEGFVLHADLPGVPPKDVKVSLMGDTLTIKGERKQEEQKRDGSVLRCERVHGAFERSFTLGAPLRADQVKATFKDGVLEVRVPKAEEARMREIEVKVA